MYLNSFRISIALEDEATGGMRLLVVHELPFGTYEASGIDGKPELLPAGADDRRSTIEGTLYCSGRTWANIRRQTVAQGAQWIDAVSVKKERYWSCKPKITVLELQHNGICDATEDSRIWINENNADSAQPRRIEGSIEELLVRVTVRGSRVNGINLD
jgi:hypothetical protein